ncbi:hypothetical protein [Hamadaea tsunoensis]|uniref:hypothetical protein n=1 Tax=Hamadaea tsunoensis TaxID=53368 RepID=UPI00068535D7|nr:hypothetical protein [Hamadaea tsunoensis]
MSLVQDLADQIRVARDELPVAEVTAAAERLRMAGGLLAWVMHATGDPARVPQLAGATERLESAVGLMRGAQDALEEYTVALGIAADSVPATNSWAATVPTQRADGGRQLTDWWAERVQVLADGPVDEPSDPADTSTELLRRCASAALDEHPARLHRELAGSGAAVGLGLAAVAPPLLRFLAADLVGHPPRLEDLARVRRAALSSIGLLPKLSAEAADEIIARVCHAAPQRRTDSGPTHPVDSAAAAALLVAGLLRATGRGAAELHAVVEEEQRRRSALAEAHAKRTALRVGDGSRRRSAVDALAGGSDAPAGG